MIRAGLLALAALALVATLGGAVWWGQQAPPDPAWDRVQQSGVLRVGTDATYPPFESVPDNTHTFVGYDIALAQALAAGLGVRAEFVNISLDGLYDALAQDKVDVLISALPFIYEKQKDVYYTRPYFDAGPLLVVRAVDSRISLPGDLAGRSVGVELGSDGDMAARRLRSQGTALQLRAIYQSSEEALGALAAGQVDAAVSDPLALASYIRSHPGLRALPPPLTAEPYVIALRAPARRLGPTLDALVAQMQADSRLARFMGGP